MEDTTKEYNVLQIYHWHFERQIEGYFYAGYNIVGLLEYQNTRYMHGGKVLFLGTGYDSRSQLMIPNRINLYSVTSFELLC